MGGKGKVSEEDVKEMMGEVGVGVVEGEVNFKVVKEFVKKVREGGVGEEVMESVT
ncbi:signal recognition particle receptor subunit alpha, partial [Bacillus altitudinis]|uniref:signal recognition particle receptor subunit alpha n=1 Tax=Bacillus altitudinis TaxID=293387 RepID=UPI001F16FADE